MIRVALEGASGYVGGELLSLLLHHPEVELVAATAGEAAGKEIGVVRPRLRGTPGTPLTLASGLSLETLDSLDLLFLALPHGESSARVPALPLRLKLIDLAADFRIPDAKAPDRAFVYGLPELNRNQIKEAHRVAAPGCFATAASLALLPALEAGVVQGPPLVSAVTGSSGSGHRPKPRTHHPERALNFFAYDPLQHRHQPEIESALARLNPKKFPLTLQVHSAPLVRGIYASAFFPIEPGTPLLDLYRKRYAHEKLLDVLGEPPELADVAGTARAAVGVVTKDGRAAVFTTIDNLLKGAASQAVQCMNLMFGFSEVTGLLWPSGALP